MKKKLLVLLSLFFVCLAVFPLAKAEKLNSWKPIEEKDTYAIYELGVNREVAGIIVHLESVANGTFSDNDAVFINITVNGKGIPILISHPGIADVNAKQDFIYLINPPSNMYDAPVKISDIKIMLISGGQPKLATNKSYVIPIKTGNQDYGDVYYPSYETTDEKSKAYALENYEKPGFLTTASSYIDYCPGSLTSVASLTKSHGIKFKSVKTGRAEITSTVFYGGVGNRIEVPETFLGATKTKYLAELKVGLGKKRENSNMLDWIKPQERVFKISNEPSLGEVVGIVEDEVKGEARDKAIETLEEKAKEIEKAKAAKAAKKAKIPKTISKSLKLSKVAKFAGVALEVADIAMTVKEFVDNLAVDDKVLGVKSLRYPDVWLEKDQTYEMVYTFNAYTVSACLGAILTAGFAYTDFCYNYSGKPCFYIETNEDEKKFLNRGIAFYDTLIVYRPEPLGEYKPLRIEIEEPNKLNWTTDDEIYFRAKVIGGFGKPENYQYAWYEFVKDKGHLLSDRPHFSKRFPPGKHHVLLSVTDELNYEETDEVVFEVKPPKPELWVKSTSEGIELEWDKYDGERFGKYEIFWQFANANTSEYFYETGIEDKNRTSYKFLAEYNPELADSEICFKVRTVTWNTFNESNKACAKMPIHLYLYDTDKNRITFQWISRESKGLKLYYTPGGEKETWVNRNISGELVLEGKKINNTFLSINSITNLTPNTSYTFWVVDGKEVESNKITAKTKPNKPPIIWSEPSYRTYKVKVKQKSEKVKPVKAVLSTNFDPLNLSSKVELNLSLPKLGSKKRFVIEDTDKIKKLEIDWGDGYKDITIMQMTDKDKKNFYPGKHAIKIRATDEFGASSEKTYILDIRSYPFVSDFKIEAEKLYDFYYGKLKFSVKAKDADNYIKEVKFVWYRARTNNFMFSETIKASEPNSDNWTLEFDPSYLFEFKDLCKYKEIRGKKVCYIEADVYAIAIDSDGLETLSEKKRISILQPLPDLIISPEIKRVWSDSELLKEAGKAQKNIVESGEIPKETGLEEGASTVDFKASVDKNGNYTFTAAIKNFGNAKLRLEGKKVKYQFYLKREIFCPGWCRESLGYGKPSGLVVVVNETNKTKVNKTKGFICPKSEVSCQPDSLICYCQHEITSGFIDKELAPLETTFVSVQVPKKILERYAEDVKYGKKVEVIFVIDVGDEILEENDFNNVVSRTIWLESRIKLLPFSGGDPTSPFYGFGRFFENVDLFFTFNKKEKFKKQVKLASKRLDETIKMIESGQIEKASNLLEDYNKNIKEAEKLLEGLPAEEKASQSKALAIFTSFYINSLKDSYREGLSDKIRKAINTSLSAQKKAMQNIFETENIIDPGLAKFESKGLNSDLEISELNMKKEILVGEEINISFNVSNIGLEKSKFKILLYENNSLVKTIDDELCSGCSNNYTLVWKAKKGISEIRVVLEDENDANLENNYAIVEVKVIAPKCYSDQDCSDNNPCTKDLCVDSGTKKARCEHVPITECVNNDSCCPAGCNALNDNDCKALCGNGICEPGEDQTSCCKDCGCPEGYECIDNECAIVTYCGNGVCDPNENRCTCPEDCGVCSGPCRDEPCWEWECVNNKCECEVQANCCGNYACEEGEYYLNCQTGEFNTQCPQDCCDPFISHQADEPCQCPPNTEKIVINPETGEFVCECPPPQQTYNIQPNPPARGNQGYKSLPSQ